MLKNDEIALVVNTVEEKRSAIQDSYADPPRGTDRSGADLHDARRRTCGGRSRLSGMRGMVPYSIQALHERLRAN